MEMVNGYVFLDLTKSNVYQKALKVLGADKPVVIKDGSGAPYFVDSLALDGTNVVITKGGKTITIANDNTITSVGDIQNHLYAISWDGSDLAFEDYAIDRFTILTNKKYNKISELPNGYYTCVNGSSNYSGDKYNLLELEKTNDGYLFRNVNDDVIDFTISTDSTPYELIQII